MHTYKGAQCFTALGCGEGFLQKDIQFLLCLPLLIHFSLRNEREREGAKFAREEWKHTSTKPNTLLRGQQATQKGALGRPTFQFFRAIWPISHSTARTFR